MADHYQRIRSFLEFLERKYGVQICIKDFIGFIHIDRNLDAVLSTYLAHVNPYCMFVKQEIGHHVCLSMMRPMYEKCGRCPDGFTGVCHAGIWELVVPIQLQGEVLGSVNISYVGGDPERSREIIRRAFRAKDAAATAQALSLFDGYIRPSDADPTELKPLLLLLADCLAQNYAQFQSSHVSRTLKHLPQRSNVDATIDQTLSYIKGNYASRITVAQIAQACYCSESYINHIFSKRIGVNINTYINKVRIEYAKNALLLTTDKISAIALDVGFSDSNYFSKVFTGLLGISPSEFRRRYTT